MDCRFYGKSGRRGALMDTLGNQCALILHADEPCACEVVGEAVDERVCPIVTIFASQGARLQATPPLGTSRDADLAERLLRHQAMARQSMPSTLTNGN